MKYGWFVFAGLLVFGAIAFAFLSPAPQPPAFESSQTEPPRNREHIAFLSDTRFDPNAPGSAIVLHPLATNGPYLLINAPDVLTKAKASGVYFTDDPKAEFRRTLLSILFLSPPGMGTRSGFVSLFSGQDELVPKCCPLSGHEHIFWAP